MYIYVNITTDVEFQRLFFRKILKLNSVFSAIKAVYLSFNLRPSLLGCKRNHFSSLWDVSRMPGLNNLFPVKLHSMPKLNDTQFQNTNQNVFKVH